MPEPVWWDRFRAECAAQRPDPVAEAELFAVLADIRADRARERARREVARSGSEHNGDRRGR